jgi:GNAT superfamily N-acetyltransferase
MIVETPAFDQATLERFYRDVLEPSFPPAELMSLEAVRNAYLGADAQPAALLVADGEPIAGILAETIPASGVLLIGYLAVHRAQRSRGHGARLLAATLPKWRASLRPPLVLAEIDDPRFHAADADTGDPWARLRWWDRAGSRLLAMPYFQPTEGALGGARRGEPAPRDGRAVPAGRGRFCGVSGLLVVVPWEAD